MGVKLTFKTILGNMLGTRTLQEILQDKENLAVNMQSSLDAVTESWGVKVERIEV
jgi:erythrocyte band 7 integral membrane protein